MPLEEGACYEHVQDGTAPMESGRVKELETELKTKESGSVITYKVSAKGAVSVYGLGRFPVTLYRSQWDQLAAKKS